MLEKGSGQEEDEIPDVSGSGVMFSAVNFTGFRILGLWMSL